MNDLCVEAAQLGELGWSTEFVRLPLVRLGQAAIRREGAGYVLHDLGSSSGTFVQIHAEHALQNGDQFRVGHHLFRVDVGPPAGNGA